MVPEWADGAIFLVPLTHDMIVETDVGNLRPQHVVALQTDVERNTRPLPMWLASGGPQSKARLTIPCLTSPMKRSAVAAAWQAQDRTFHSKMMQSRMGCRR